MVTRGLPLGNRSLKTPRPLLEWVVAGVLFLCALLSIVTTIGIVLVLLNESIAFFAEKPLTAVFDTTWSPVNLGQFGLLPLISGTLLVTTIALMVALPFGLLIAIYLAEYAKPSTRRILKPVIEILAGVPTVVYGFFALLFVTPLLQEFFGLFGITVNIFNALSAGIVMGIMVIPTIASLSEDAIYAVPRSLREGAYALGGSKVSTIFRVVLPAASSGIIAAVILGISRAIGETMIVTIAAGGTPKMTADPLVSIQTMTAAIVERVKGELPHDSIEYRSVFVVGLALFLMTLALNLLAQRLRKRFAKGSL